ncbi:MAG: hypothetical protein ACRD4O_15110 [Bryobacteraceae bacterium]
MTTESFDFAPAVIGDFSDIARPGLYQIRAGEELSPPFFIRHDAWRRFLPLVVSYHRAQRCGVAVANVHDVCHLDDARRRVTAYMWTQSAAGMMRATCGNGWTRP